MEKTEIVERLTDLARLDIDAFHAYGQAIKNIEYEDMRQKMTDFQDDHRRHVDTLSSMIRDFGGTPPEFSRDFKGYLIEGFTALRSITGTKGALEAMETNEILTNRKYGEAAEAPFPEDVGKIMRAHLDHEKAHLSWIRMVLQTPRREL